MKISIIGLGKLGLPWLSILVENGYNVIGVDKNEELLEKIKNKQSPYYEKGIEEFLKKNYIFNLTTNIEDAIKKTDITFIVVPTPSDETGKFSNKYILDAMNNICNALKNKNTYHLIVITSTIMPETMDKVILPYIEKNSNKNAGKDFGLCYNPEFIALGEVKKGMVYPDFVLIGEYDKKSGDILEKIYKKICRNNPPIKRMNFINAEICKISVNSFITMKISYANMLAELCDKIENANAKIITDAMGSDSRIGKKYLSPGGKYGGPCFPRDNIALSTFYEQNLIKPDLLIATEKINNRQTNLIIEKIMKYYRSGMKIGIAGISYKEDTDVIEKSQGLELVEFFSKKKYPLNLYNFNIPVKLEKTLNIKIYSNEEKFINDSDIIVKTLRKNFTNKIEKILIDIWDR